MRFFLSRLHFPVTTLGPGRRVGIWFQGCSLRCPGCVSADTWTHGQGETTVGEMLKAALPWLAEADGVTISGGEPFEQIDALECLLTDLRAKMDGNKDVLIYSGQSWEKIAPRVTAWPGLADAVISDPFVRSAPQTLVWRGSDNQRLQPLTELGRERYATWLQAIRADFPKALDVCFDGNSIWMAGIPDAGSLGTIQRALAEAGFSSAASNAEEVCAFSLPVFA